MLFKLLVVRTGFEPVVSCTILGRCVGPSPPPDYLFNDTVLHYFQYTISNTLCCQCNNLSLFLFLIVSSQDRTRTCMWALCVFQLYCGLSTPFNYSVRLPIPRPDYCSPFLIFSNSIAIAQIPIVINIGHNI